MSYVWSCLWIPCQSPALTRVSTFPHGAGSKLLAGSVLFFMWNLRYFKVNPQTALNISGLKSHPKQGSRLYSLSLASYVPKQFSFFCCCDQLGVCYREPTHRHFFFTKILANKETLQTFGSQKLAKSTKILYFKKYTSTIWESLHRTMYT